MATSAQASRKGKAALQPVPDPEPSEAPEAPAPPAFMVLDPSDERLLQRELPVSSIVRGDNHRTEKDSDKQRELNASVKAMGILQPILVRPLDDGSYSIIAGFRRFEAAIANKMEAVPVIVRSSADQTAYIQSLVENVQREDISDLDEAAGYQRLLETPGPDGTKLTQSDLAKLVGMSQPYISNQLRLLKLPQDLQDKIRSGDLAPSAAKAIISLPPEAQKRVAKQAVKGKMTATQVENEAKYERQRSDRAKSDAAEFTQEQQSLIDAIEAGRKSKDIRKKTVIVIGSERFVESLAKKGYVVRARVSGDTVKNGFACDDDAVIVDKHYTGKGEGPGEFEWQVKPLCVNRAHPDAAVAEERQARQAELEKQVTEVNAARALVLGTFAGPDKVVAVGQDRAELPEDALRLILYGTLVQPFISRTGWYNEAGPIEAFLNRHPIDEAREQDFLTDGLWGVILGMTAQQVVTELVGISAIAVIPNVYADTARESNERDSQVREWLTGRAGIDQSTVWGGHEPIHYDKSTGEDEAAFRPHIFESPGEEWIAEMTGELEEGEEFDESEVPCAIEGCERPRGDEIHNVEVTASDDTEPVDDEPVSIVPSEEDAELLPA